MSHNMNANENNNLNRNDDDVDDHHHDEDDNQFNLPEIDKEDELNRTKSIDGGSENSVCDGKLLDDISALNLIETNSFFEEILNDINGSESIFDMPPPPLSSSSSSSASPALSASSSASSALPSSSESSPSPPQSPSSASKFSLDSRPKMIARRRFKRKRPNDQRKIASLSNDKKKLLSIACYYKHMAESKNRREQSISARERKEALLAFRNPSLNIELEYQKIGHPLKRSASPIKIEKEKEPEIIIISDDESEEEEEDDHQRPVKKMKLIGKSQ